MGLTSLSSSSGFSKHLRASSHLTPHELLVNKLCALLSRSELRDLDDVRALLAAGGDLARAVTDAPKKDLGFSPLTLAWALRSFDVQRLANAAAWEEAKVAALASFRDELIERLVAGSLPEGDPGQDAATSHM